MDYVGIILISVTCAKCAKGTQTGLVSSKLECNPLFYYVASHDLFSSLLVLWIRCCVPVVKTLACSYSARLWVSHPYLSCYYGCIVHKTD